MESIWYCGRAWLHQQLAAQEGRREVQGHWCLHQSMQGPTTSYNYRIASCIHSWLHPCSCCFWSFGDASTAALCIKIPINIRCFYLYSGVQWSNSSKSSICSGQQNLHLQLCTLLQIHCTSFLGLLQTAGCLMTKWLDNVMYWSLKE